MRQSVSNKFEATVTVVFAATPAVVVAVVACYYYCYCCKSFRFFFSLEHCVFSVSTV